MQQNEEWWRGGVIYQIYPRSFQDSNNDGCGDLTGITQRLDYVAQLGIDAIWISPFFPSPMDDFGYDITDYKNVDGLFGTLEDFDALIAKAHKLNIKVIIDLVISHTSKSHPWFVESSSSDDNPKRNWYVWADAKPDGSAPNNWLSVFGGNAWQWHSSRCQYYLHNFLTSQPDLNFHEPEVQTALLDVVRFWLDQGVDGFRLDTVNFYFHDQQLRDNPVQKREIHDSEIVPSVNPYSFQKHIYDRNRPEVISFLEKFRSLVNEYPARAILGEIGDAINGLELVGSYTKQDARIHMCYSFELLSPAPLLPAKVNRLIRRVDELVQDGWICWALSNHDVSRHITRFALNQKESIPQGKMLIAMLLALRGTICIYQGEELGLSEADVAFEDLQDPYGIEFWPKFKGRDGCRTPMPWQSDVENCGFSSSTPWLPLDNRHNELAVNIQQSQSDSMLAHYRKLLGLRSSEEVLRTGDIELVRTDNNATLCFRRTSKQRRIQCYFNFSDQDITIAKTEQDLALICESDPPVSLTKEQISLPPYGFCWAAIK